MFAFGVLIWAIFTWHPWVALFLLADAVIELLANDKDEDWWDEEDDD